MSISGTPDTWLSQVPKKVMLGARDVARFIMYLSGTAQGSTVQYIYSVDIQSGGVSGVGDTGGSES